MRLYTVHKSKQDNGASPQNVLLSGVIATWVCSAVRKQAEGLFSRYYRTVSLYFSDGAEIEGFHITDDDR